MVVGGRAAGSVLFRIARFVPQQLRGAINTVLCDLTSPLFSPGGEFKRSGVTLAKSFVRLEEYLDGSAPPKNPGRLLLGSGFERQQSADYFGPAHEDCNMQRPKTRCQRRQARTIC